MARCHRIGQKKDVRIYRLITKDTYEQNLFECSSRKYGLDEAILGSMQGAIADSDYNANIENLLKRGAYSILKEDGEAEAAAFHAQNIKQILESRTEKRLVGGRGQNTFSVATFISNPDIDSVLNEEPAPDGDPLQFWQELLPEACNAASNDDKPPELTSCGPRKRLVVNYREGRANSEPESCDEEHETSKSRRHRVRKRNSQESGDNDNVKQWSEKEIKQLENWLIELGANRTEDIMVEAGLQHHGIQEVQQLCDVLIRFCHYFQARNAATTNISNSAPIHWNAAPDENIVRDPASEGSDCQIQGWNASTFKSTSRELPTSVGMHSHQGRKDMETTKNGDEKPEFPSVINVGDVEFPTIPPYAQKALHSQAFTKRLEKKATRYLQLLQEREILAKSLREGNAPPLYVRRLKKLPIWWSEANDADLLLGVHRHGHRNFCKIREDKSLCFSSKPDLLKFRIQEKEDAVPQDAASTPAITEDPPVEPFSHPDQEEWPRDAVLAMRLRQLIQALQYLVDVPDRRNAKVLEVTAPNSCFDERASTTALAQLKFKPSKKLHSALQRSSRLPRVELCDLNFTKLPPSGNVIAQKPVSAVDPLATMKTKIAHDQRSMGKENLHFKEFLDVPNTSSEGSGDEYFQKCHLKKTMREPHVNKQRVAPPEKAYSINMGGASRLEKPSKSEIESMCVCKEDKASSGLMKEARISIQHQEEAQRPGNLSVMQSEIELMCVSKEDKASSGLVKEAKISTQQEKKWPSASNVSSVTCATYKANQREPLVELNAGKRKTCIEAPLSKNKKPKEAGKQQTLLGFLAQKLAPKRGAPC